MNHILLGASLPFLIGCLIYGLRRGRTGLGFLITIPVSMAVGALWALAPDIPRILGFYRLYNALSVDPRCDIFFWHYSIDKIETDSHWHGIGFVLMLGLVLITAWLELKRTEENT